MFALFILLWLMAGLVIYANPKETWAWWAGGCLFLNGFGGIAAVFKDNIIPWFQQNGNQELVDICVVAKGIADMLQHYLATYAMIVFLLLITNFLYKKLLVMDVVHVAEVIKNLILNSIEAIKQEGRIDINTEFTDKEVCISVIDNGIGIPKECIDKVLTPFYSTKKSKDNFGLGLSYCYKVMKSHKGNLKIKSKENQGTSISLLFPKKIVFNN